MSNSGFYREIVKKTEVAQDQKKFRNDVIGKNIKYLVLDYITL